MIATLKCIGASRRTVFSTYLAQLTVLAGLGVLAGLVAGALAPVAIGGLLEELLPTPIALGRLSGGAGLERALRPAHRSDVHGVAALPRPGDPRRRPSSAESVSARDPGARPISRPALGGRGRSSRPLAIAAAPDREFALWFTAGAALTLFVLRGAGWAAVRAAKALHERGALRIGGSPLAPRTAHADGRLEPLPARPNSTADIVLSLGLGLTVLVTVALVEGNLRRGIEESLPAEAPARSSSWGWRTTASTASGRRWPGSRARAGFRSVPFLRGRDRPG